MSAFSHEIGQQEEEEEEEQKIVEVVQQHVQQIRNDDCVSEQKRGEWINYNLQEDEEFFDERKFYVPMTQYVAHETKASCFIAGKGAPCVEQRQ